MRESGEREREKVKKERSEKEAEHGRTRRGNRSNCLCGQRDKGVETRGRSKVRNCLYTWKVDINTSGRSVMLLMDRT